MFQELRDECVSEHGHKRGSQGDRKKVTCECNMAGFGELDKSVLSLDARPESARGANGWEEVTTPMSSGETEFRGDGMAEKGRKSSRRMGAGYVSKSKPESQSLYL